MCCTTNESSVEASFMGAASTQRLERPQASMNSIWRQTETEVEAEWNTTTQLYMLVRGRSQHATDLGNDVPFQSYVCFLQNHSKSSWYRFPERCGRALRHPEAAQAGQRHVFEQYTWDWLGPGGVGQSFPQL